jgi:hypothetical protein
LAELEEAYNIVLKEHNEISARENAIKEKQAVIELIVVFANWNTGGAGAMGEAQCSRIQDTEVVERTIKEETNP